VVQGEPCRGGERQDTGRIVVPSVLRDRGECRFDVCRGVRPPPLVERQHGKLRLGEGLYVWVAERWGDG
jgi:hypothetical protein